MSLLKQLAPALFLWILSFTQVSAQKSKDHQHTPLWVAMMDDPNVNYYEACKAYDEFWKGKEKPKGEDEIIGQRENVNSGSDKDHFKATHKTKKERRKEAELAKYAFLCKRFENWRRENQPYVKPDGHIMNSQERLNIWQQQKVGR